MSDQEDELDQEAEEALRNFTTNQSTNDSDFDDAPSSAINNFNAPVNKVFLDKSNFPSPPTINILSPTIIKRNEPGQSSGTNSFTKTINNHDQVKVLNSRDSQNISGSQDFKIDPRKMQLNIEGEDDDQAENIQNNQSSFVEDTARFDQNSRFSEARSSGTDSLEQQWDGLERKIVAENSDTIVKGPVNLSTPLLSYQDAVQHFKNLDMSMYEPDIVTNIQQTGIAKFLAQLCGPPRLKSELKSEKKFVFCMARCQFDNEEPTDFNLLLTIYKSLTGTSLDCGRYGSHWTDIGFQGNDPATDLRGTGMLGLLTILYITREHKTLSQNLYQLSLSETQNFPFCVLLINLSRLALLALRSGHLNKECNKRFCVLPVVVDLFAALTYEYYKVWKNGGKTIRDSGYVLKDLEQKTKSSSADLINNFKKYTNEKAGIYEKSDIVFLNVCNKNANSQAKQEMSEKKNKSRYAAD